LFDAGCARLHIFNYKNISKYDKILYLDTDILINSDINVLFNLNISPDQIYVLEEGTIGQPFWGSQFFDFKIYSSEQTAFTSGIIYFKNSDSMKLLFGIIRSHILNYIFIKKNAIPECLDQPFIIYNAVSQNKYDNQLLKKYVENNPSVVSSEKIIYHFPGCPGFYSDKQRKMNDFWGKMNYIPKVLFQTNKTELDDYVADMISLQLGPGWKYEFYNDKEVIQFFMDNPINDLPDIIKKYNSIEKGAHKADLFRYYYLYINGGFFMDSDAMVYVNMNTIVKQYHFVSVNSSCHPGTIFQGILGASPKNEIIKKALYKAYNTDLAILNSYYHYFCKQLYDIIHENNFGYNVKLYEERRINNDDGDDILDGNTILFKHYWKHKNIPNYIYKNLTNWNNYNKSELHEFDYRILTAYDIPTQLVRIGPKEDGGYVIADGFEYDLFISCGVANDVRFEEDFLDIHKIKCIAFDGTIETFPSHRNNIEWVNKNIGYKNTEKTTNLKKYIQNNKKIFLKMDIEGSEFNWIDSMTEKELNQISQIVIEFHWPFDIYRMNMLKKLNKTHYIIHVHGNNGPSVYNIHNKKAGLMNIIIPEVFEVTYINKKLFDTSLKKINKNYPVDKLDYGNHPDQTIKQIEFCIPNNDTTLYVGSSNTNTKMINLKTKVLLGHNLINKQDPNWKDTFDIKLNNTELSITRMDLNDGWGQEILLPIKHNKILIYNGFNFHYEMIGFILDFCKKYEIGATLVLTCMDKSWVELYKTKYTFDVLATLPKDLDYYLFVLVLTDDDISFPNDLINENVVCIDHFYTNRRINIKHHLPITPFNDTIESFTLPIFNYISYHDKINLLTRKRPIISFVGNSSIPSAVSSFRFIDNFDEFDVYIINRSIPKNYIKLPNVFLFENISAEELFKLLSKSTYICYIPNNSINSQLQMNCQSISASIPISFTTGCKLIIPSNMNKYLRLTSIIEYSIDSRVILEKMPSLKETFQERDHLMKIRDKSLFNLKHMQLYLDCKNV
jgi:mannosyltransferase OCH1-like enzyme